MKAGSKRINPSSRPQIDTLKSKMRFSTNPFDGTGHVFKQAIKELREEGINIKRDAKMCRYYNIQTVAKAWGY